MPAGQNEFRSPHTGSYTPYTSVPIFFNSIDEATNGLYWIDNNVAAENGTVIFDLPNSALPANAHGRVRVKFQLSAVGSAAAHCELNLRVKYYQVTNALTNWTTTLVQHDYSFGSRIDTSGGILTFDTVIDVGGHFIDSMQVLPSFGLSGNTLTRNYSAYTGSTLSTFEARFLDMEKNANHVGEVFFVTGTGDGQQVTINGVANFEVVPSADLQQDVKTAPPEYVINDELQLAQNLKQYDEYDLLQAQYHDH
jgi:hypothetical protein